MLILQNYTSLKAVKNAGLLGGPVGLIFVSILAIHCMHLLAENAEILSQRHKSSNIDYAGTLGSGFFSFVEFPAKN